MLINILRQAVDDLCRPVSEIVFELSNDGWNLQANRLELPTSVNIRLHFTHHDSNDPFKKLLLDWVRLLVEVSVGA